MTAALWVCDHWIAWWFAHRHTGTRGHRADACRRHVRYWISVKRSEIAKRREEA